MVQYFYSNAEKCKVITFHRNGQKVAQLTDSAIATMSKNELYNGNTVVKVLQWNNGMEYILFPTQYGISILAVLH